MFSPRWLALPLVLASFAGCIPERDNRRDSAFVPDARLRVTDVTLSLLPERVCGNPAAGDWPTVTTASRGACLVLDASASADPQGFEDLDSFRFYLLGSGGTAFPEPELIASGSSPYAAIPDERRLRLSRNVPLRFRVVVEDESGRRDGEETEIVLFNAAPVAVPDPVRMLSPGGSDFLATFSGIDSYDADGDPLEYCWRFERETDPTCVSPEELPLVRSIASTAGSFVATLTVKDPTEDSLRARTAVTFGPRPIWAGIAGGFAFLDGVRANLGTSISGGALFLDRDPARIVRSDGATLTLATWPGNVAVATSAGNFGALAFDPRHDRLWSLTNDGAKWWTITGDLFVPGASASGLVSGANGFAIDDSGTIWLAGLSQHVEDFSVLQSVSVNGALSLHPPRAGWAIVGLGNRPTADGRPGPETWTLQTAVRDGLSYFTGAGQAPEGDPAILRHDASNPDGVVVAEDPSLLDLSVLAWIDEREFWTVHPDRGALRVDADLLAATSDLDAATLVAVDLGGASWTTKADQAHVDPLGNLWLLGSSHLSLYVSLDGRLERYEYEYVVKLHTIDDSGVLHYQAQSGGSAIQLLERNSLAFGEGIVRTVPVPYTPLGDTLIGGSDPFGGVWAGSRRPALVHISPDGRIREFPTVREGGADVTAPTLRRIVVSRDGSRAWATTSEPPFYSVDLELLRFDLTQDGPEITARFDVDLVTSSFLQALVPAGTDGQDLIVSQSGSPEILRIDPSGDVTVVTTLEDPPHLAMLRSGGVCAALEVLDPMTSEVRRIVRVLQDDGSSTVLEDVTSAPEPYFLNRISGGVTAGGEPVCWAVFPDFLFNSGKVRAWSAAGQIHESNVGAPMGILGAGEHDVWVLERDSDAPTNRAVHLRFVPTDGGALEQRFTVPEHVFLLLD